MKIEIETILFFVLGLGILYFMGQMIFAPAKTMCKFLANSLIGAAVAIGLNLVGRSVGFYVPINPVTAIIIGTLGLPGILLIFLLKLILGF